MEHFRILIQLLVRHIDLSWNAVEPSLMLMYEKLAELGFVYCDGNLHILDIDMEGAVKPILEGSLILFRIRT